jgi:hypothetical protein
MTAIVASPPPNSRVVHVAGNSNARHIEPFQLTMTPLKDIKPLGGGGPSPSFFTPQSHHSLTIPSLSSTSVPSSLASLTLAASPNARSLAMPASRSYDEDDDDEPDDEATAEGAPSFTATLPGAATAAAPSAVGASTATVTTNGTGSGSGASLPAISAALTAPTDNAQTDDVEVVEEGEAAKQPWSVGWFTVWRVSYLYFNGTFWYGNV